MKIFEASISMNFKKSNRGTSLNNVIKMIKKYKKEIK